MVNLSKTINSCIKDNISNTTMYNDLFPDAETQGVISVHDPSPRKIASYIDGSNEFQCNISYTARYKNPVTARSKLDAILNLLDGRKLTDSTDGLKLSISANSNIQFIGTDDKEHSIYSCSVTVDYLTIS